MLKAAARNAICLVALLAASHLGGAATPLWAAADLQCSSEEIRARGVGFLPSRKESEEAAKKIWLEKATKVYSDATVETAKEPKMGCAKQGLYTNCTMAAFPCGTVKAAAQ